MPLTVFLNDRIVARGGEDEVMPVLRGLKPVMRSSDLLVFDDDTGRQVDLDIRVDAPPPRRGRPSMGVEAREVTLLPRHWAWLAGRQRGASATLRQLVEEAMRAARSERECRDTAYRFLTVAAGDRPGYEEAIRALYAGDRENFDALAMLWPDEIANYARRLAWPELQALETSHAGGKA